MGLAEALEELKEEENKRLLARGPLVPEDLPSEVWEAVAANYTAVGDWEPGPAYHAEYRDARTAVEAYKALQQRIERKEER